jgi:hypothetical protein
MIEAGTLNFSDLNLLVTNSKFHTFAMNVIVDSKTIRRLCMFMICFYLQFHMFKCNCSVVAATTLKDKEKYRISVRLFLHSTNKLPEQKLHTFQLSLTIHHIRTLTLRSSSIAPTSKIFVSAMILSTV